jgi:hypothetical protein
MAPLTRPEIVNPIIKSFLQSQDPAAQQAPQASRSGWQYA